MISTVLCSSRTGSRSPCFANITIVRARVSAVKSHLICRDHNGNLIRPESGVFEEAGEHRLRHLGFNGQSIPHTLNLSERVSNMWSPRVLPHFVALSGPKSAFRGSNLKLAGHRLDTSFTHNPHTELRAALSPCNAA